MLGAWEAELVDRYADRVTRERDNSAWLAGLAAKDARDQDALADVGALRLDHEDRG